MSTLKASCISIAALLLLSFSGPNSNGTIGLGENLKGKVKSFKTYLWDFHNSSSLVEYKIFNEFGLPIEDQTPTNIITTKYNNIGQKLSVHSTEGDESVFEYDSTCRLISKIDDYYLIKKKQKVQYIYDNYGLKIEEDYIDYNEDTTKSIFVYDSLQNTTREISYEWTGTILNKNIIHYDEEKDNVLSIVFINNKDSIMDSMSMHYNSKNQLTRRDVYSGAESKSKTRFIYKYDKKGNLMEETCIGKNGKINYQFKYIYKYDTAGNWIKETDYENGRKKFLNNRVIEYY